MNGGSEEEADADFFDGAADAFGGLIERDAEGFEDVGGAAAGTDGAIAVFGDADSRAGDDERGGGGNVERAGDVAASARSEERRVGKECRSRWSADPEE